MVIGARHHDLVVFKWLAHWIKCQSCGLGELAKKQDTAINQESLGGARLRAAAVLVLACI